MANEEIHTPSQEEVDTLIDVALQYKKLPSQNWNIFDASVEAGTSKYIFDRSQNAWLVYAAADARTKGAHKFDQKEECRRLLEILRKSDLDALVKLLDQRIQCRSDEEKKRIQKLGVEARNQRKKRRLEDATEDQSSPGNDNREEVDIDHSLTPVTSMRCSQETNTRANNEMQWEIFSNASLDATVSLFPQFLADAIDRRPHFARTDVMFAAVDMQTPSRSELYSLGCVMAIHVVGRAIFRLARDLFDVYVEQDTVGAYIAYPAGAKLRPQPSLKLEGARIDAISTFFGEQTHQAIRSSSAFQEDLRRRYKKTAAVTMTIDTLQGTSGTLFLSLGVVDGGTICSQLYLPDEVPVA